MNILVMVLAATALVIGLGVLLALVVLLAGIHAGERHMSLTSTPRTRAGSLARRTAGASVRRPHGVSRCRYQQTRR
jgi:hypothetical protein